jgi:hypothetical protein
VLLAEALMPEDGDAVPSAKIRALCAREEAGFWKHGFGFLRVFVPTGVPIYLERIPVRFEHSPHGEKSSCIPAR